MRRPYHNYVHHRLKGTTAAMPILVPKPDPGLIARKKLKSLLDEELQLRKANKSLLTNLSTQWVELIREALEALEYGEIQSIFRPAKTKDHGLTPFTAKKCRMMAVGFCDLLRAQGYKKTKALSIVRQAYGNVRTGTIEDWEKKLSKIPWFQAVRMDIANSTWSEDELKIRLKEAGSFYVKHANKKKKSVEKKKE